MQAEVAAAEAAALLAEAPRVRSPQVQVRLVRRLRLLLAILTRGPLEA